MKYIIKVSQLKQDDIATQTWRHVLGEITTKIIPPQEYEFFERKDYRRGITAVFFFKNSAEDYEKMWYQLNVLANTCIGEVRITILELSRQRTFPS